MFDLQIFKPLHLINNAQLKNNKSYLTTFYKNTHSKSFIKHSTIVTQYFKRYKTLRKFLSDMGKSSQNTSNNTYTVTKIFCYCTVNQIKGTVSYKS